MRATIKRYCLLRAHPTVSAIILAMVRGWLELRPLSTTKKQGVARCAAPFLFQPVNELSTGLAVREFLSLPGFPEGAY
jgi:hypothetical protein